MLRLRRAGRTGIRYQKLAVAENPEWGKGENIKPHRLTITARGDGLELALSYSYTGKLPRAPVWREAVREMLQRAMGALDEGVAEGGFNEDGQKKPRRDVWIKPEEAGVA